MKALLFLSIIFFILGFLNKNLEFIYINTSNSLPYGFYLSLPIDKIHRGDLLLMCLDSNTAFLAKKRHYISKGSCPHQSAPLGKYVQALNGDMVTVNKEGIYVNYQYIEKSKSLKIDALGRPLPLSLNNKILKKDEFLVVNSQENSFDSRYFGVIKKEQILSRICPILIFN